MCPHLSLSNPAGAMSEYTGWCGKASPAVRCLLKIMPGVYDIGASTVVMRSFIDIQGSGENVTFIQGNLDSNTSGVVTGASNAEIRFLTVDNTGGGNYAVAILNSSNSPSIFKVTATASGGAANNDGVFNYYSSSTMTNVTATTSGGTNNFSVINYSSSPVMTNVTATASGGTYSYGVYNYYSSSTMTNVTATGSGGTYNDGVCNYSSSPTMTNVTATASGGTNNDGVYNYYSSPTMTNVTATASGGTYSYGVYDDATGTVKINHSVISGSTNPIYNSITSTYVGNTQLNGGAVHNSGTLICAGVYDENYTFYPNTCP